jgi:dihydrofolate reductase
LETVALRKIIVLEFITLDGVMQAGGSPDEDTSDGFKYGGWAAPYLDAGTAADEFMAKQLGYNAELLLGRKTFEAFASFWPTHGEMWPGVNDVKKYVVSDTEVQLDGWNNSVRLKNLADIKKLKESEGQDLQVHGSGVLVQTLLEQDLVDELWLKTLPIILGQGKRLFGEGNIAAAFTLTDSLVTSNGVIFANYKRAGEVKTGTAGA